MGWEVITNNLSSGSLEDLPTGYRIDKDFINAFIDAFKERSPYTYAVLTESDFDEILIGNSSLDPDTSHNIGSRELTERLAAFNQIVRDFRDGGLWYKQDTWDDIEALDSDFLLSSVTTPPIGLGLVSIEIWSNSEIEDLLGEETYNDIFVDYSVRVSLKASYWSGIYKLLKYVFKYLKMNAFTSVAPEEITYPIIYFNGSVEANEGDIGVRYSTDPSNPVTTTDDCAAMMSKALDDIANAPVNEAGLGLSVDLLFYELWAWDDNLSIGSGYSEQYITSSAGVTKEVYVEDPFLKIPTNMEIVILAYSGDIYENRRSRFLQEEDNPSYENDSYEQYETKEIISASRTTLDDPNNTPTYSPDLNTYRNLRGHKLSNITSYEGGLCKLNINHIRDILEDDKDIVNVQPLSSQGGDFVSGVNQERNSKRVEMRENFIIGELPQNVFQFPI